MGVLTILTIALLVLNRQRIVKVEKAAKKVKILKQNCNEEININISCNGINSKPGFWPVW